MTSPLCEPGNRILDGVIRKEQEMYFHPGVQTRRAEALRELYGGHPPDWKSGPKCFPVIVIPRIVPESALPLLPRINTIAPREFKDGNPVKNAAIVQEGSFRGSFQNASLKEGSVREGSLKNSTGSVKSSSSQRSERLRASQSDPALRPIKPKKDPAENFGSWAEETVKFPFKRPG